MPNINVKTIKYENKDIDIITIVKDQSHIRPYYIEKWPVIAKI